MPFEIALALALAAKEPVVPTSQGWAQTGRIVDREDFHLGIRPAFYYDGSELDFGVTIQVSLKLVP
jgi:hypothetical protein